jgi:hypothetical protein
MRLPGALLLVALAAPAHAEWAVDLYGGVAYTPRSDLVMVVGGPGGTSADHTFHDPALSGCAPAVLHRGSHAISRQSDEQRQR